MISKYSKRVLSLFLAVLMIVTSIPIVAVTTKAGEMTSVSSPVYYDAGTNDKTNGVSAGTDTYKGGSTNPQYGYTISANFNLGNAVDGNSIVFSLGWDNDSNTSYYFLLREDGSFHYNYEQTYFDRRQSAFGDKVLSVNTNYQAIFVVIPNGSFETINVYLDGELVNTINTENEENMVDKNKNVRSYFTRNLTPTYGRGCGWWTSRSDGSVSDLAVFNAALTPDQVKTQLGIYKNTVSVDANMLLNKMTEFETKISNSNVPLTNMKFAYDAYVQASKAYDAYVYGANKDINLEEYYLNLDNAIGIMNPWSPFEGAASAKFYEDDNPLFYSNVLYSAPTFSHQGNGSDDYIEIKSYNFKLAASNEVTLLGTRDDEAGFPVTMEIQKGRADRPRQFEYVGSATTGLKFVYYWYGYVADDWTVLTTNTSFPIGYDADHKVTGRTDQFNAKWFWSNKLCADYDALKSNSMFNNYVATISGFQADAFIVDNVINGQIINNGMKVNVIDYQALIDTVNTAVNSIQNVSDYKEGGLSDLLTAIDNAQNWNPNSYFTTGNDITSCVAGMQNVMNQVTSAKVTADSEGYQAFRSLIDSNVTPDAETNTAVSITDYNNLVAAGRELMKNPVNNGYKSDESATLSQIVDATKNVLNPKVDTTALSTEIQNKKDLSIFSGDVQEYTLQSWVDLNSEIEAAEKLITDYSEFGKYASQKAEVSGVTYQRIVDFITLSNEQQNIDNENDKLASMSLDEIIDEAVESFDAASEVASTIPVSAYDGTYRDETIEMVDTYHDDVYVTAEEATNSYGCDVPETFQGEVVLDCEKIDDKTTAILTKLSGLEEKYATYIVTVTGDDAATKTVTYGESYKLPEKDVPGVWKLVLTDKDGEVQGTISQTVPAGKEYSVTVESNIEATFEPSVTGSVSGDYYTVNVLDKFGNHMSVLYAENEMTDEEIVQMFSTNGIKAKTIPFYDFKSWKISYSVADKTYTARPEYTFNSAGKYTFYVNGKHIGDYNYDSPVIISDSSIDTPYAWVNKTEDNKYQIASYSESFKVFACADGDYYPVYERVAGEKYCVIENGEEIQLTSDKIDGNILPKGYTDQTADEHLNFKLKEKYPFIYVDGTKTVEANQYRVYAKFTEGATKYKAFGVIIGYDGAEYKFNCTNKTSSNQFAFTIKINGTSGGEKITFKPYVNHWFMFQDKTIDAFYYDEAIHTVE